MSINVRTKGQQGERDIAGVLNKIVSVVRKDLKFATYATRDELFQRNQNQSAVGGSDLSSPMPLEIEVKRQEALSINTWWGQCTESAERTGGIPILIFRQSRKKWRVIMYGDILLQPPGSTSYASFGPIKVEIDMDDFEAWFKTYYSRWLAENTSKHFKKKLLDVGS